MLITCPDCATRYDVSAEIVDKARKVRCSACGATWRAAAEPQEAAQEVTQETDAMIAVWRADAADDTRKAIVPVPMEPAPSSALEAEDVAPVVHRTRLAAPQPRLGRRRAAAQANRRRGLAFLVGCGLTLGAVGVLERNSVVAAAPELAGLYAQVGLPINLRGLEFRDLTSRNEVEDGVRVLAVEGEIVSVADHAVALPALRLALRGAGSAEIHAWTVDPPQAELGAGESVRFRSKLTAPPAEAEQVFVRFARGSERGFGSLN